MTGFSNNFNALPPVIVFTEPGLAAGEFPALTPGTPAVVEGASPFAADVSDTLRELPKIGPRAGKPFALGPFQHRPTPAKKRNAQFHLEVLTVILRQGFCGETDAEKKEVILYPAGSRVHRETVEIHIQIIQRDGSSLEKRRLQSLLEKADWKQTQEETLPRLRFRVGDQTLGVENWKDGKIEIGRGENARAGRWSLAGDPAVSRRHAALLLQGGAVCLMDLGGPNGTQLNGDPLRSGSARPLRVGDVIRVGETDLVLEGAAGMFELPPPPVAAKHYRATLLGNVKGTPSAMISWERIPIGSDQGFVATRFSTEIFFYWENGRLMLVDRRKNPGGQEHLVPLFVNGKVVFSNRAVVLSEGDEVNFWGERLLVLFSGQSEGRRREFVEKRKWVKRPCQGREEDALAEALYEAENLEEMAEIVREVSPMPEYDSRLLGVESLLRSVLEGETTRVEQLTTFAGLRQKARDFLENRRLRRFLGGESQENLRTAEIPKNRAFVQEVGRLDLVQGALIRVAPSAEDRELLYEVLERGRPLHLVTRETGLRRQVEGLMSETVRVAERHFPSRMRDTVNPHTGERFYTGDSEAEYRLARNLLNAAMGRPPRGLPKAEEQTRFVFLMNRLGIPVAGYIEAQRVLRRLVEKRDPRVSGLLERADAGEKALLLETYFGDYRHRDMPDVGTAVWVASAFGLSGLYREVGVTCEMMGEPSYSIALGEIGSVMSGQPWVYFLLHTHPEERESGRVPKGQEGTVNLNWGSEMSRRSHNILFSQQDVRLFVQEAQRYATSGAANRKGSTLLYDPERRVYRNWVLHPFGGSEIQIQMNAKKTMEIQIRFYIDPGVEQFIDGGYQVQIDHLKKMVRKKFDLELNVVRVSREDFFAANPFLSRRSD